MKIQHLIPILFLAGFCTVSAQTNNAPANVSTKAFGTNEAPDAIDWFVAEIGSSYGGWQNGAVLSVALPETASAEEVVSNISKTLWYEKEFKGYNILEIRQIHFPLLSTAYTAALIQMDKGQKIILYERLGTSGWEFKVFDAKNSAPKGLLGGDTIWSWIDFPYARDPEIHLAFVQIVSIADERHTFTNALNSKVSDDNGKTWYNLLNVRSGLATVKIIECPGFEMPRTVTVYFKRHHYVPTRETPWTDDLVKPGARLLGFFSKKDGEWVLEDFQQFIDPLNYLTDTARYGSLLQALFKTPLSDEKTIASRRRELDEMLDRARQQEATNNINQK
jgi:hypothetical protein